jgi:GTP-binding protein
MPADGSDPVENANAIVGELERYSPELASKPRWIVFNKIDLLPADEVDTLCSEIAAALDVQENIFKISAVSKLNTKELCFNVMDLLDSMPKDKFESEVQKEVEFKWDTYHQEVILDELDDDDDDWDEDDYDVEVVYQR